MYHPCRHCNVFGSELNQCLQLNYLLTHMYRTCKWRRHCVHVDLLLYTYTHSVTVQGTVLVHYQS